LEEIGENKFLESSLRDLLKHKIAPAYYMQIYQTPIQKISTKLNELWKHVAVPTKYAPSETGKDYYILNINEPKQTQDNQVSKKFCEQTLSDQEKFQQITQQLQEVSPELQKVQKIQDSSQIRCYRCNHLGHIAKSCNNHQMAKKEKTKPTLNRRGQDNYQLTQNDKVQLKMDQTENCRGDDENQFNTHFKKDVESTDNFQLESSEDENTD